MITILPSIIAVQIFNFSLRNVAVYAILLLLSFLLLIKEVVSARLSESGIYPISPKTPVPQYQPIDWKNIKGKNRRTL